jgi:hypothetical protein
LDTQKLKENNNISIGSLERDGKIKNKIINDASPFTDEKKEFEINYSRLQSGNANYYPSNKKKRNH